MESPDPIPISALQHWRYCPRQCALIHLEQAFDDNLHTARGNALHARVDTPGAETRAGCRIVRALPLWSDRLGLSGRADVVEFLPDGTPYPVEYKHGRRRVRDFDELQLAAQAICLEEMTGRSVTEGALFYAGSKKRRPVRIDTTLRQAVEDCTAAIRSTFAAGRLPPPVNDERCRECSLRDRCQPEALAIPEQQRQLLARLFEVDE
ncbi:CRISPR-associated protein Cas4 [Chitinimonas koreensis]|uniref:CRISPR-associated protein Cas4 n=1 Tax=Chitinimonas koreensis TaxID=356302 RepID=UPI00041C258B|nr:CRISPR-associated protein Cas4 [Chitinimonas koreensis]QNM98356.1 CRISPR-associated protein Cas4 [Chitinimonas koreensis]